MDLLTIIGFAGLGGFALAQQGKINDLKDEVEAAKELGGTAFVDNCKTYNKLQELSILFRAHAWEWQKHLITTFHHIDNGRGTPTAVKPQLRPEDEFEFYARGESLRQEAKSLGIKLKLQPWDHTSKRKYREEQKRIEQEGLQPPEGPEELSPPEN